jgi:hypothetical protein
VRFFLQHEAASGKAVRPLKKPYNCKTQKALWAVNLKLLLYEEITA